jgi:membrane dipeptidase
MSNESDTKTQAAALLHEALVIDGHNDSIVAHIRHHNRSLLGPGGQGPRHSGTAAFAWEHEDLRPRGELQLDLPRMKSVGLDVGFFAVDVTPAFPNHLSYALDCFGYLLNEVSGRDDVQIVRRVADIHAARRRGATGVLLAVEHADATARSLNVLRALYELGVRAIGLTHNVSSWAADGCAQAREGVGLTDYGVALVQEMNRLGMVVDLAHVSPGAFAHALEASSAPVIFSHGNARALRDHRRNLSDAQLRALAAKGGVIGLSLVRFFVADDDDEATVERWVDHAVHVAEVAGIATVGLGSDFDGGGMLLDDVTALPLLVEALQRRGFSDAELRALLGGNLQRVLVATIG